MRTHTHLLWLVLVSVLFHGNAQQANIPSVGDGMSRTGFVHRFDNWTYPPNVLAEWKKTRGNIDPSQTNGVLTNPYRKDGTSLSFGIEIPENFTGRVPVFTEGNWWPAIGPNQTSPLTYTDLGTDTGAVYQNGQVTVDASTTRRGVNRVKIINKTPYNYLVSSGVFPGNEQPGQVMNIIPASGDAQLPIPPRDWWEIFFAGQFINAVPEVYSSVAGLNPLDAPGWKHSSWSPRYQGGIQARDFGTAGFAYTFGSLFGRNDGTFDLSNVLFAGFHTNEGYDPLVSGDPGYGCAFYINGALQAVMDITLTGTHTAQAVLVAHSRHNPGQEASAFGPGFSHLKSIIGVQPNEQAELHYITHETAQQLISQQSNTPDWKRVEKTYDSNTQANVQNVPLPPLVDGNGTTPPVDSCTDGIQNGNETGIDCGGNCAPCATPPTNSCTDGIQNGNETGIDCGGDCAPCAPSNTTVITGKFVPKNEGTLLGIGQDAATIDDFVAAMQTTPAVVSGYTSINNVEGIDVVASYGTGPQHLSRLASQYPNSALLVAVFVVDQLDSFNRGQLDDKMDLLIDKLVALDRPIYMRWGYEFDAGHNHFDPNAYIASWRKIHARIKEKGADKNIAMVWHSGSFCGATHNNLPITAWYPGKEYVDLMGITAFTPQDCDYRGQRTLLDFARQENKPVIIAESTPQGYDLTDNTIAPLFGNTAGNKSPKTAQQIWDEWYQPYFDFINKNKDVIRVATYINTHWDSQDFWDAPYQFGYWGDARVQVNNLIRNNWTQQTNAPLWIKNANNLFDLIGYTTNDGTPPANTCNDGIQNGTETGIDCGGDCTPCATPPTSSCTDGIQNGNETGIDCGGSCTPCANDIGDNPDTGITSCDVFGISYIDDNTARVFHKDQGFRSQIFMCVNDNCYAPTLANGYYYFDFNSTTTFTFVTMTLGNQYTIEFKADFRTVAKETVQFTRQSCLFNINRDSEIIVNKKFTVAPNPATDFIQISGSNISDTTLYQLYNMNGKVLQQGKGRVIDISTLPKGAFFIKTDTRDYSLVYKN